ncbi:hypothetical protein LOC68_11245 [Blastopirellula sp. JC732]|uniref:Uncharacterized protein n=1 Tax=Blastopirellula sediminis TaxID=2894196 RepID=A0A9X1MLS8_9BACT|nr:hypothetical protein [Blastopirellula sediminis]MCC9609730.1 hypothetical protein [Blastopirellula sediminis]MCC9628974.1 hypothetical protein [Blastopirellula sediminis]
MISRSDSIRLATCDEVFEILTRAPFPTGDAGTDNAVERHLCCCHDCRTLAEALRPATSELAETLPEEASRLPQVDGDFWRTAEAGWTNPPIRPSQAQAPWLNIAVPVAAVLVALLVVATFWGSHAPAAPGGAGRSLADVKLEAERYLANLSLPAVCQPRKSARPSEGIVQVAATLEGPSLAHLTCCSECHHHSRDPQAKPAASTPTAIAAVTNSCLACHAQ